MLSLVYVSAASHPFSDADLGELLKKAREKNTRLKITGMLLYKNGTFVQVLEGPDEAVRQLFNTISADDRHQGASCLQERQIERRQFPDWKMAFQVLDDSALMRIEGYSEFLEELEEFRAIPSSTARLLEIFRNSMNLTGRLPRWWPDPTRDFLKD
jgi:hypothetical protein